MAGGTLSNNSNDNNPCYSPLSQPPWPQFPAGIAVQLRDLEAERFFKRAMGRRRAGTAAQPVRASA